MMVHTRKPRTWEVEAEFMTSLGYKPLSFEKKIEGPAVTNWTLESRVKVHS